MAKYSLNLNWICGIRLYRHDASMQLVEYQGKEGKGEKERMKMLHAALSG